MSIKFRRRKVSNAEASSRELSAAEFIPYLHHWDSNTIITKDDELLQIIKVEGFSFETADDEDVDMKKMVRNSLLKSMAEGTFSIWFHTIRRRHSIYPEGEFNEGFADYLDKAWRKKQSSKDSYVNELYVTVVRKKDTEGAAKFEHWYKTIAGKADKKHHDEEMQAAAKELNEAVFRVLATFKDYGAKRLSVYETKFGPMSEPLEFLFRLINCGEMQAILVPSGDVSKHLPCNRMYFSPQVGIIEIRTNKKPKFAAMVSIREYSPATAAGMMDSFLQLSMEFVMSQSFSYKNRQTSIGKMQTRQRRMMASEDPAISQVAEISDALDMVMSGHVAMGEHNLSVMCTEDNIATLEESVSMVIAELVNLGINPVREKMVLEQTFWAQLPANYAYVGRRAEINTLNVASFASLHNYPVGSIAGNHWGDAVTVFGTTSGTPYFFNFHMRDVGHTTIIGPTGAGKTVLMNFLVAQAQKYNCRTFMFDKDRGAEIFVRALGGQYSIIQPGRDSGFNPLQLPETMENKNFLVEWLASLISVNGEVVNADEMIKLQDAINGSYKLDKKDRILRNIVPFLGLEGPGTIATRLKMWHSGGQYAGLFDNDIDVIDFSKDLMFGFEMGEVLANKVSLAPTLLYLFHRVHLSLDGTPTMIILDEAWALIDNPIFSGKIRDWLKTMRKLNGMVVFATQSVEDATKSDISDTLIQQTATQIFLPNPKATESYKSSFMITDREFDLLKTTDPATRFFLVKQGSDVVVARIDLSGMDDVINILSGRADTVRVLDKVRAEVGDNPDDWIPAFTERLAGSDAA